MKNKETINSAKKLINLAVPPCPIDYDDLCWFKDRRGMAACDFAKYIGLPIDTPLRNLLAIAHTIAN